MVDVDEKRIGIKEKVKLASSKCTLNRLFMGSFLCFPFISYTNKNKTEALTAQPLLFSSNAKYVIYIMMVLFNDNNERSGSHSNCPFRPGICY